MIEEVDKPKLFMVVPQLNLYLLSLGRLTDDQAPLQIQLRTQRQAVAYLMVDVSGLGFGLVIWF